MTGDGLPILAALVQTMIASGTPLILIGIGVLVVEQAGVLNLGVEGMAAVGALVAFAVFAGVGNVTLGLLAAGIAGGGVALIFALVTQYWRGNQTVAGLGVTLGCLGLTSWLGRDYDSVILTPSPGSPFGGSLLGQPPLVYLAVLMLFATGWGLRNHLWGWMVRACGESPQSVNGFGLRPSVIRSAAILYGGVTAGLGGGYVSLYVLGQWQSNPLMGRGWIALALAGLAGLRPLRLLLAAYGFGAVSGLSLTLQASGTGLGFGLSPHFMNALPYCA
ncbi:MAG: ABC transporter permease, partial [Alphaproteobacteria bacterium]|nr:ABC transporter permease [Alphaproteobacteria bacterium]